MNVTSIRDRRRPSTPPEETRAQQAEQPGLRSGGVLVVKLAINLFLRLCLIYFMAETLMAPDDPRFAGKGLEIRNVIIVVGFSMLFPFLYLVRKKWPSYPFGLDNLWLSIFWADMAGNSLHLFDTYEHFDLIPHFYGPGALAVVLRNTVDRSALAGAGLANTVHMWLEIQEYYGDVLGGTRNVRGVADTVNDMAVGLLATTIYCVGFYLLTRRRPTDAPAEPGSDEEETWEDESWRSTGNRRVRESRRDRSRRATEV
jgi:hypothetical protein